MGQAHVTYLHKIRAIQNKVLRVIANVDYDTPTADVYKQMNILKLNDLYNIKIMSLMWDFDHNVLPSSLNIFFSENVGHGYQTRSVETGLIQIHRNFRTAKNKSFAYMGTKMYNEMKTNSLYNPALRKITFLKNIKLEIINRY